MLPFDLPNKLWFRCKMDQDVYRAIRKLRMATVTDIGKEIGLKPPVSIQVHMRNLLDMDLIHVVGHYGGNNRAVYALLYKDETV